MGANHARSEVIEYIRREFSRQVYDSGRERLVEKTPSNALRLEFVDRVLPDCKVIHIIRNGIDASLSIRDFWDSAANGIKTARAGVLRQRIRELDLRRMPYYASEAFRRFAPWPLSNLAGPNLWGPRIPGLRGMLKDLDMLEVSALQWRTCVESACDYGAMMSPDRYIEVKLEELTLEKFRTLLEFSELEAEPAVIENFERRIDIQRSTGRRCNASEADIRTLRKWIGPTMNWLGYEMPNHLSEFKQTTSVGSVRTNVADRLAANVGETTRFSGADSRLIAS